MKRSTKYFILLMAALVLGAGTIMAQEETVINFVNETPGSLPAGWTNASGKWIVKQDGENKVMAQTFKNKGSNYNVAVYDGAILKDVELSVDIKAISGEEDQGGGLVWRYIDNNNYYIVRFNPLEDNFRFYKVVKGRRIQLASTHASVPKGTWFNVKAGMKGNEIICYLNGEKLLEKSDETFTEKGKTGFWTKADAVSNFNSFSIKKK